MAQGPTILLDETGVRIPGDLVDLAAFRRWAQSDAFPETGRIDWIGALVEVDMSPENLNFHGTPKVALSGDLRAWVEPRDLGAVYSDRTRLISMQADLSAEPDVVVLLFKSIEAGTVWLVPAAGGGEGNYVEIEGAADLVVEVVSNSSVQKDWERLFERYFLAGVREYWICDARKGPPTLSLHHRGPRGYEVTPQEADGFARSEVLGAAVRFVSLPPRLGIVRYRLETR